MRTPEGLDEWRWRWMLLRRPRTERFFLLYRAAQPAGFRNIRVYGRDAISDARLVWKVCHECRRGVISKISLSPEVQRQGLGTLLIDRALLDGPGYRWTTSSQSPHGREFFRAMSARTGAAFTAGARTCEHMLESRPGRHKPVLDRRLHAYAAALA
ncbi:GNAT family N-acetyltransferase [Streptomyces sp. NBC_00433]